MKTLLKISFLAFFYVAAWQLQNHLLLKGDIAWQMHLARVLLAGGHYVTDFFEINPPLSIYLYMPAVILQKIAGISAILALRIYILSIITFSLGVCAYLCKKLFSENDALIKNIFLFALVYTYLILPLSEFGQRECLLLYFTMPYFLLVSLRLEKSAVCPFTAVGIGLLAGIGLGLKPFFLLVPFLVELYYLSNKRRLINCLRPETLAIAVFLICYVLQVYISHPEYFKVVVPLAAHFYYQSFSETWNVVLLDPIIFYTALVPLIYLFALSNNPYKKLCAVLTVALWGFLLIYSMQRLSWYYHLLPAFALALIVCILLFGSILQRLQNTNADFVFAWVLGVITFAYPVYFVYELYTAGVNQKNSLQPIISELHQNDDGKPVYFFSSKAAYMVSVLEHSGAVHASRLQFLAWMNGYFRLLPDESLPLSQQLGENLFVGILAQDIIRNKPALIFIDRAPYNTINNTVMELDYLKTLSRFQSFKVAWEPYHYVKTVKSAGNFKFDIYSRS